MVISGELTSPAGRSYPIVRSIPRFVGTEAYASSFGFEWSRWPRVQFDSENVGRPMAGYTSRMWDRIVGSEFPAEPGRTVVEFGCGSGRFLDLVRKRGGRAVGIDISRAVEAARENFATDPDVLIVQGDSLQPPFREGTFDGGYSIGVLHHTPNPAAGVKQLTRVVKRGGRIAVCVYPRRGLYDFPSVGRFRRWHARLAPRWGYRPALWYSRVSAYLLAPLCGLGWRLPGIRRLVEWIERDWLVVVHLPDARWRFLDVFDAITPSLASTHTEEEVREWFSAAGCAELKRMDWCETSLTGQRS
jgi:SAM-dependent methyltransferase